MDLKKYTTVKTKQKKNIPEEHWFDSHQLDFKKYAFIKERIVSFIHDQRMVASLVVMLVRFIMSIILILGFRIPIFKARRHLPYWHKLIFIIYLLFCP